MSTAATIAATCSTTSSSVAPPSGRPSVNAKPLLVVASAGKPSDSSTRALPTSQGFGMTNGAPACSSANRSACDDTEHILAVAVELRRADPGHERELGERARTALRDLRERRVVEHDVRGHLVSLRALRAPLLQCVEAFRDRPCNHVAGDGLAGELAEEPRRLAAVPRQEQVPPRAGHADVEEPAFLVLVAAADRELSLLEAWDEHGVELEPLRPVERQEMDAASGTCAEALAERRAEVGARPLERRREPHEPREIGLARLLAIAELFGRRREPAFGDRQAPHAVADGPVLPREYAQQPARRVAVEQRRALERDLRLVEQLLEVGRACVRPHEHGNLLERHV